MATTVNESGHLAHPAPHAERGHSAPPLRSRRTGRGNRLRQALGWFSIGVGLAALLAPRKVGRAIGIGHHAGVLRALGVREIVSGVGVLGERVPEASLGMRLAGDVMDVALLQAAARSPVSRPGRVAWATAGVVGIAALDLVAVRQQRKKRAELGLAPGESRVEKCITVNRSPDECYRFWREFDQFPRFMKQVQAVRVLTPTPQGGGSLVGQRSLWRAKGPAGIDVEWEAEVVTDRPGEEIAWRSVGSADVDNAGAVRFEPAPGGHGTVIWVRMSYRPFGHRLGVLLAKIFGEDPDRQVEADLRRVKQLLETGEIATTAGQPSGSRSLLGGALVKGIES